LFSITYPGGTLFAYVGMVAQVVPVGTFHVITTFFPDNTAPVRSAIQERHVVAITPDQVSLTEHKNTPSFRNDVETVSIPFWPYVHTFVTVPWQYMSSAFAEIPTDSATTINTTCIALMVPPL
jgi:hypothetical protein